MNKFKIKAIPFLTGSLIVSYFSTSNYEFSLVALFIFIILRITKQVDLI